MKKSILIVATLYGGWSCSSNTLLVSAQSTATATMSSSERMKFEREQKREARKEERKRRQYQKFEESYVKQHINGNGHGHHSYNHYSHHHHHQRQSEERWYKEESNTEGEGEGEDNDDVDYDSLKKLYDIYKSISPSQQSPRHILQGAGRGFKCAIFGFIAGLPFLVGLPIAFYNIDFDSSLKAWIGALIGLAFGGLTSAALSIAGLVNGAIQVVVGLWNTPSAISSYFFQGKLWNDEERRWDRYSLDDESEELLNSTQFLFSDKVSDSTFYDLLNVKPGATAKEIKRGYYSKAKDLHPDKNRDDDEAAQQFILLHEAYETLSDPDKRAKYDAMGRSKSSSSSSNSLGNFNVGVFFEILFASQPAEPYIGQLGVSSFFSNCMKFLEAHHSASSNDLTLESIFKMFQASETQRKQRPVQVALHLREFIKSYVRGDISKQEFEILCSEEAEKIAENSFGEIFLFHIGNALVQEANLFRFQSWFGWPLWLAASTKKKTLKVQGKVKGVKMISTFVTKFLFREDGNGDDDNNSSGLLDTIKKLQSGEKKLNTKLSNDTLEKMLPHILDMAWAFNAQDIAAMLEQACEKVLFDSKAETSSERSKRAKALYILGETFARRGQGTGAEQCFNDESTRVCSSTSDPLDIKARLNVAFQTAQQVSTG